MYMFIHTHIHTYSHTYIHTYIHTYALYTYIHIVIIKINNIYIERERDDRDITSCDHSGQTRVLADALSDADERGPPLNATINIIIVIIVMIVIITITMTTIITIITSTIIIITINTNTTIYLYIYIYIERERDASICSHVGALKSGRGRRGWDIRGFWRLGLSGTFAEKDADLKALASRKRTVDKY